MLTIFVRRQYSVINCGENWLAFSRRIVWAVVTRDVKDGCCGGVFCACSAVNRHSQIQGLGALAVASLMPQCSGACCAHMTRTGLQNTCVVLQRSAHALEGSERQLAGHCLQQHSITATCEAQRCLLAREPHGASQACRYVLLWSRFVHPRCCTQRNTQRT